MQSKQFLFSLLLCFTINAASAQFYKSIVPSPAFNDSLNLIINDYLTNYHHIQGELLSEEQDVETFHAIHSVPGAIESFIYRFHSVEDTTASFQAIMYRGENFKEAAKIYRNTFRLVNKAHFTSNGKAVAFSGTLQEPSEDLRFNASPLLSGIEAGPYKNFMAEVEMIGAVDGWEVHLNLQRKKDDREKY